MRCEARAWIRSIEDKHRAAVSSDPKFKGRGSLINDEVERRTRNELRNLFKGLEAQHTLGGLADVVHGVTHKKYGWGHDSPGYWSGTRGSHHLATETFAHFFECEMANPEALEVLKSYMPNSYKYL